MPTVPTWRRQVGPTPLPAVRRTPQQEGAGVGQAVAEFGGVAANIGLSLADQHLERLREREDHVNMTKAIRSLGELETQVTTSPDKGYLTNVRGADVLNQAKRADALGSFDEQAGMITQNTLTNDRQRMAFERIRDQRRQRIVDQINDHGLREFEGYEKGEAVAGIETAINLGIANASNPDRLNEELTRVADIVHGSAGALGLRGPVATAAFLQQAQSKVYEGAIEQLIVDGKHSTARAYFDAAVEDEQLSGDKIARIKATLEDATTDKAALDAVTQLWAADGPIDDKDDIDFDAMASKIREQFQDDPKKYEAAMRYHRERFATAETGRKQRADAIVSDLFDRMGAKQSLAQIMQSESWLRARGDVKREVREYIAREQQRVEDGAYREEARAAAREGRAAARESRAEAAANRREREATRAGLARFYESTDPSVLRSMSRGDALLEGARLGSPELQGKFLAEWEQAQKAGEQAAFDRTVFNEEAADALGEWVYPGVTRDETQSAQLGRALSAVKTAIARESAGGKRIGIEQQREIVRSVLSGKVRLDTWGADEIMPGSVVNPDDRTKAYVSMGDIDGDPTTYGATLSSIYGAFRKLVPAAAKMDDATIRKTYAPRIQRAVGRAFAGASKAEIDAAVLGQ